MAGHTFVRVRFKAAHHAAAWLRSDCMLKRLSDKLIQAFALAFGRHDDIRMQFRRYPYIELSGKSLVRLHSVFTAHIDL